MVIIALAVTATAGLAACATPTTNGARSNAGTGTSENSPTPAPNVTTAATGNPAATGSPTVEHGGANADCTLDHLDVAVKHVGGAAGHSADVLVFTNTGNQVCRLFGYPGVAALDPGGNQAVQAARSPNGYMGGVHSGAKAAFLSKGESAAAVLEWVNFTPPDGSVPCPTYAGLLVTPPNETHSIKLTWTGGCSGLQIHPVVLGVTGQD